MIIERMQRAVPSSSRRCAVADCEHSQQTAEESCDEGATVTLCTADGVGHCWLGSPIVCGTTEGFGTGTNDIDAAAQMATFFTRFSLP
jgi:poly(3-hydroxybutyrate) depolymerase